MQARSRYKSARKATVDAMVKFRRNHIITLVMAAVFVPVSFITALRRIL